jgi:protease-4
MRNFLLGLLSGIVLCVLAAFIFVFILVRVATSFGERPVEIADGSTLIFNLEGEVPEKAPLEIGFPLLREQSTLTIEQVWENFKKAAADPRIKAIVFEPRNLQIGWGKMQEIHQEMLDFRKSGKPLVAYLRGAGAREYYLATSADRIYMTPEDLLDVKGLRVEGLFLKNTMSKLGVRVDIVHAGKYKDAGDIFTRTTMSPETKEVLDAILDQYYGDLIDTIAAGRNKDRQQIRAAIDNGPFFGRQALDAGLVDVLGFEDQVSADLQKRLGQSSLVRASIKSYARVPASETGAVGRARIAFIAGEGEITRGEDSDSLGGAAIIRSGAMVKLLHDVQNDSSIKGAIIRIDSPGGDGIASDDILHAARDLSRVKPVVISMGDVAASGGYFISMTGDPVLAYPNTLTGSIGVIYAKFDLHGLYDKIGVDKQVLKRGQYADLDSDYEPLTGKNLEKLTQEIDRFYGAFVSRVADGRKRLAAQIEPLAQGRVWTGSQAKQNGLVDNLGGIDAAIDLIRQRAHIGSSEKVRLVVYPPKRTLWEAILSRGGDENAAIEVKLRSLFGPLPIHSLSHGGFLKLPPYTIVVK